jgi:hypothetical protein
MAKVAALPEAMPHAERGKMGGRGNKARSDRTSFPRGDNDAYLAARLKRDAPDIAARIDDYPSIRAAALAAGIIRERTPLDVLRSAWRRASPEERARFLAEVNGTSPVPDTQRTAPRLSCRR